LKAWNGHRAGPCHEIAFAPPPNVWWASLFKPLLPRARVWWLAHFSPLQQKPFCACPKRQKEHQTSISWLCSPN
jgi:hypothetical protein